MNEIWKDIEGYKGFYQVSNFGRVMGLDRNVQRKDGKVFFVKGRILIPFAGKTSPYLNVQLCYCGLNKKFLVHILVAKTFLEYKKGLEVNHKDGNVLNNDVENLELITHLENIRHSIIHGFTNQFGENSVNASLTNKDAIEIRKLHKMGFKQVELAKRYKVCKQTISNVIHNKRYKDENINN